MLQAVYVWNANCHQKMSRRLKKLRELSRFELDNALHEFTKLICTYFKSPTKLFVSLLGRNYKIWSDSLMLSAKHIEAVATHVHSEPVQARSGSLSATRTFVIDVVEGFRIVSYSSPARKTIVFGMTNFVLDFRLLTLCGGPTDQSVFSVSTPGKKDLKTNRSPTSWSAQ